MNQLAVAPTLLETFKSVYSQLDSESSSGGLLNSVYSEQVLFQDPLHQIEGLEKYKLYCADLYANVSHCRFNFEESFVIDGQAMLTWEMIFQHSKMNGGMPIQVPGASHIKFSDKIYFHRDYYDAGALLYEHVPVLRSAIRFLKKRIEVR